MSKRLPSLTSLRSFEAAARNLSFARAADELSVTPAAVGFQIKQLEEELGATLFVRKHRAIELTEKGRGLLADLGPAFDIIQTAWDSAHEPRKETTLKVSGPAKAVHSWVMPALAAHDSHQPNVRISWDISRENRDLNDRNIDIAIRWAREPDDRHHWEPVLCTWFTPVMRPGVARFVQKPKDLRKQGLIGVEFILDAGTGDSAWAAWHRLNGLEPPDDFAISCADTATAVDTALATGQVAIAGSFLAADRLASGELVAPFDTAISPFSRFWLVCRKGLEQTPEFRWFLDAVRLGEKAINARCGDIKRFHPDGSSVCN